ncbi:MAG: hypothetical protein ACLSBH_13290 [Coprobacillus cateniformis]
MEFIYYPKCSTCLKALKQLQAKEYQIVKEILLKKHQQNKNYINGYWIMVKV